MTPAEIIFTRCTTPDEGCWIWNGPVSPRGYGTHGRGLAHRLSYEAFVGPIPEGFVIDHLCRNSRCVRPSHLEAVTQRENVMRGHGPSAVAAHRATCAAGHPLAGDNLREYVTRRGARRRICRTCHRERSRAAA